MSGRLLGLAELSAIAFLGFAALLSGVGAVVHRLVRPYLLVRAPDERAAWIFAVAAAPVAGALILTAACLLPSIDLHHWHLVDHCSVHGGWHPHLCLVHLPPRTGHAAGLAALAVLAVLGVAVVADIVGLLRLSRNLRRAIGESACRDGIDAAIPIAATVGFLRPRVVVSAALRRRLAPGLVDAIIAHEGAHVRRRDALRQAAARILSRFHLPAVRRRLLRDLHLACEQACDEQASAHVGDRLLVAQALIAMEQILAATPTPLPRAAVAFGDTGVAARVHSLVADPLPGSRRMPPVALALLALAVFAAADPIHHGTETVLGLLTR
jgi:Zn-dependent protease with chaperone function